MTRVGVMTCALDELACAAFAVGPFVDCVDVYVFIDTGSQDGTPELIEDVYADAIGAGRLIVERIGRRPDYDMSIARNRALELLREHHVDHFVKIDADDIFYDDLAVRLVATARELPPRTHFSCPLYELYQWEAHDDVEWLEALRHGRDIFWEMSFIPRAERISGVVGARAQGKWGDEAAGARPEGIYYEHEVAHVGTDTVLGAHYGWAKPVRRKREKIGVWYGDPDHDPRVDRLHEIDDWRKPQTRFRNHPQVIERQIHAVLDWIERR